MTILFGFVALAILLMSGIMTGRSDVFTAETVSTLEERIAFLRECGWETDPDSETVREIHIPERFTAVYENYNALQLCQGYDLTGYAGRDCTLYSYTVLNYPDDSQTVIADLYVFKNRIIGGDVHSTSLNGFMIALR